MDELTEELIKEGVSCLLLHNEIGQNTSNVNCLLFLTEQAVLAQYEESMRFNEEALCAAVQSLSTDDIICPLCQK